MNGNSTRQPGERYDAMLDGETVIISPEELREVLAQAEGVGE